MPTMRDDADVPRQAQVYNPANCEVLEDWARRRSEAYRDEGSLRIALALEHVAKALVHLASKASRR